MNKVVFLDRDGTINVDHTKVHSFRDWTFTHPRIIDALWWLQFKGNFNLALVTNQSGVGLGLYSLADMFKINNWLVQYLKLHGIKLAVAFCPHHPDENCPCRKPNTLMANQIEQQIGTIDYHNSWMIGDRPKDMLFGKNINSKTILIQSQYAQSDPNADFIAKNIYDAHLIIKNTTPL